VKTLFIHGREDIRLEDVPMPEPGSGEVRLRIAYELQVNRFYGDERLSLLVQHAQPL